MNEVHNLPTKGKCAKANKSTDNTSLGEYERKQETVKASRWEWMQNAAKHPKVTFEKIRLTLLITVSKNLVQCQNTWLVFAAHTPASYCSTIIHKSCSSVSHKKTASDNPLTQPFPVVHQNGSRKVCKMGQRCHRNHGMKNSMNRPFAIFAQKLALAKMLSIFKQSDGWNAIWSEVCQSQPALELWIW